MSKLKKSIYIVKLLKTRGQMTRQQINAELHLRWPDDPELSRSSFGRYLDFINENLPYSVTFSQVTKLYTLTPHAPTQDDDLFDYLVAMYDTEASAPLLIRHRQRVHHIERLTGTDQLDLVLQAIDEQRGIECDYQSFAQSTCKHRTLIPVFLTTWEGRWYCVAEVTTHPDSQPYVYALERMSHLQLTPETHIPRYRGTYADYFRDSYGIQAAHPDDVPQDLLLRAYGPCVEYLRAKPLHPSQTETSSREENGRPLDATFRLHVTPCYNLYQQLLYYRDGIEILSPPAIRDELRTIAHSILARYDAPSEE